MSEISSAPDECVGTLLVHQRDLQALTPRPVDSKKVVTVVNNVTEDEPQQQQPAGGSPTILRRITKRIDKALQAPLPPDEDPSTFMG